MIVGDSEKVVDCAMKIHDGNQFMDEFRGFGSDNMTAENFTGLRMAEHFDVSVRFA